MGWDHSHPKWSFVAIDPLLAPTTFPASLPSAANATHADGNREFQSAMGRKMEHQIELFRGIL